MFGFFKRKGNPSSGKKRVMVYVDFEHWYISMDKLFHSKPELKAFRDELSDRYDVIDIAFFGDFSNPSLRSEIQNIRMISNTIIETQNTSPNFEKDFTDFIMLDHIYQSAIGTKNIDAYVIFTGDGHFSSAVSFLVNKCRKEVGVYAVKGAVSNQLISCASYARIVPDISEIDRKYASCILDSLKKVYDKKKDKKKVYPTFWATVEIVSKSKKLNREKTGETLRALMRHGYVFQTKETVKKKDTIKVLNVNWQAVVRDKLM